MEVIQLKATPNDTTIVLSSKPCQSALTSKLVSMRNAMAVTHPKSAPFQNESKALYAKELYLTADNTVSAL